MRKIPTLVRSTVLLLLLLAIPAQAQDQRTRKERVADRIQVRRDARSDPHKWDRMALWSVGFGYGMGYTPKPALGNQLEQVGVDPQPAYRLEAARRIKQGWYLMAGLEHTNIRSGGVENALLLDTRTFGFLFGNTFDYYQGDIVTVEHKVSTLNLMTGLFTAPFPRRHGVGLTVSLAGGLGVHLVAADHGVARRQGFTVSHGFLDGLFSSDEPDVDVLALFWDRRQSLGMQQAMGLGALMDIRMELWLGRHVSVLLTTLHFTIPLVQPHFHAVNDAEGEVLRAYDLNLLSARVGTGVVIHF